MPETEMALLLSIKRVILSLEEKMSTEILLLAVLWRCL